MQTAETKRLGPKKAERTDAEKWMSSDRWGTYTTDRGEVVTMFRRGQRVRFYTAAGKQVGPEQANVAPAITYAIVHGWESDLSQYRGER